MDARLYKAAIRGDVTMLQNLFNQEQHLLHGVSNENPLHVAAQFGHVDFAQEILSRKPEYAHELNSHGINVSSSSCFPERACRGSKA